MVEGETYGYVKSFCYLGDTLDGNGADLAATARIRNGWMKFGGRFQFLTSRAPLLESSVFQLRQKQYDSGKRNYALAS